MPGRVYAATWGRVVASVYDRVLAETEAAGLRERRAELLRGATGDVLEVGAGTGANADRYPSGLGRLVLTEPDRHMAARLEPRAAAAVPGAEVVSAGAQELPFEDASFDTAVSTLVLCTVDDPHRALAEVARVLRPGGRLLFLEHVRSEDPGLARWQDRFEIPWRLFAAGCRCNRDTVATIGAAGFELEVVERGRMPKAAPLLRPLVTGSARIA